MAALQPPPDGYHHVNPYIVVDDGRGLIEFLSAVFRAEERGDRELTSDGRIDHAEVTIGDSVVMISEASERYPARPCVNYVYFDDADAAHGAALAAGASSILKPADQPWGDRVAGFHDPFDNRWWVATRASTGTREPDTH